MIKKILLITTALLVALILTACDSKGSSQIVANVELDTSLAGTVFGKSALIEIGNGLYYDTTTKIVYWWNGNLGYNAWTIAKSDTTPTPYYAPNGLPYRYNPETNTFEEIHPQ